MEKFIYFHIFIHISVNIIFENYMHIVKCIYYYTLIVKYINFIKTGCTFIVLKIPINIQWIFVILLILFVVRNFRGTCLSVEMLKQYMVRKRLGTPDVGSFSCNTRLSKLLGQHVRILNKRFVYEDFVRALQVHDTLPSGSQHQTYNKQTGECPASI